MTCAFCVIALVAMSLFLKEPKAKGAQSIEKANAAQQCTDDVGMELEDMAGKRDATLAMDTAAVEEITVEVSDLSTMQVSATSVQKCSYSVQRHWALMVSVMTYGLVAFVVISFDELMIWDRVLGCGRGVFASAQWQAIANVLQPVFSGRAIFASGMFTSANILVANTSLALPRRVGFLAMDE
mmetsp:Transcript_3127/g.10931  ORF Transcript_3127/g.10931 Transcript_3127/m.10931 type:complete len:183 (-) Transcript_3127:26-574(-)